MKTFPPWTVLLLCVIFSFSVKETSSERFLALFPVASKSHKNFLLPVLQVLMEKGHEVTMVSGYETPIQHQNFQDVLIPTSLDELSSEDLFLDPFELKAQGTTPVPFFMFDLIRKVSTIFMEAPQVQRLLNEKWELVFVSVFINEFVYGAVHTLGTPFILVSPGSQLPWHERMLGVPIQLPYASDSVLKYFGPNTFLAKVTAFTMFSGMDAFYSLYYLPTVRKFVLPYYNDDLPSFDAIGRNASLILTNTHHSIEGVKPTLPVVVEAGGAHCRPGKPITSKDLSAFLDGSGKNGFIYFSLGSVVQERNMPEKYRRAFLDAFEKMSYRVLWKWETEHMDDLPSNVKLIKWAPQQDILAHPKIRLFITHGGGLSIQEAIYHGVPFIGFPLFADQPININHAESVGICIGMNLLEVNEEKLIDAVEKIAKNQSYKINIDVISKRFRDQNPPPLDNAVNWVEYVLRHNGAHHLKPAIANLPWYQYYWLDVFAFIFTLVSAILVLVGLILYGLYRAVRRCLCGRKKSTVKKIKKR